MPDAHWLTEARVKGTKIVVIACEYSATATKADEVVVVRPGTTPALALGLSNVILQEKLYDAEYVRQWTDMPILVRMDTLKYLKVSEIFGGSPAVLKSTFIVKEGEKEPPPIQQTTQNVVSEKLRNEWGDYVWWDADPEDRPFRGWKERKEEYEVARLMCRVRYYPGTPRGVTRMWFNMYAATPGSQKGQKTRKDGLAKNELTNYQAMFCSGSHQSATRGWLKPTWMTDSLVRKGMFGQGIGKVRVNSPSKI